MTENSTALATRESTTSIGKRARGMFDPGQLELIRATVAKDCETDAELGMFLELCARYELDPFAREIWCVKMKGRLTIIVARDGLLALAQRTILHPFEGMEGDVVRANDTFVKKSGEPLPEHSYTGGSKERGEIVGAWATVYRADRKPTYFFAPFEEYMPTGRNLTEYTPWRHQVSAMILKCAEAMSLRKAFSLTGIVAEEELGKQGLVNGVQQELEDEAAIEWGDDEQLGEWLEMLFAAINAERAGAYLPAKQRMILRGKTQEEREVLAAQLVEQLAKVGARVPTRPEAPPEGEVVQDAEIVSEDEPPADYEPVAEADSEEPPFGGEDEPEPVLPGQETIDGLDK